MQLNETLTIASVEDFLTEEEAIRIIESIAQLKEQLGSGRFEAGAGGQSVHSIPGLDVAQTVAVYEPQGRIEITELPQEVQSIMRSAFERHLDSIRRAFPSVRQPDCWLYFEYGPGQYITPHADYANNDDRPEQPKIAALNVFLNEDFEGGEFYVETCGSPELWQQGPMGLSLVDGVDYSSEWFRNLPRTRWVTRPRSRTALLFGSQLVHGTNPVTGGRVMKVFGFLS